jgi:hypothetical protein
VFSTDDLLAATRRQPIAIGHDRERQLKSRFSGLRDAA